MARDLNVVVGDRVRLTSNTDAVEALTIAGIYSQGQGRGRAYITLRTAQSLYGLGAAVNAVLVKVVDIFRADEVAVRIQTLLDGGRIQEIAIADSRARPEWARQCL